MRNSTVKIHALNEKYFKESPYKITNIYLEDISELSTLISYLYKKQQDIKDIDESLIHVQSDSLTLNLTAFRKKSPILKECEGANITNE